MPDRTKEYLSYVSLLKRKNTTKSDPDAIEDETLLTSLSSRRKDILKPVGTNKLSTPKDAFVSEADNISTQIHNMRSFIISTRPIYLNLRIMDLDSLPGAKDTQKELGIQPRDVASMDESQKDVLDTQLSTVLKNYFRLIKSLSQRSRLNLPSSVESSGWKLLQRHGSPGQHKYIEHREAIIAILEQQLIGVSEILSEMQERRLKKNMDIKQSFLRSKISSPLTISDSTPRPSTPLAGLLQGVQRQKELTPNNDGAGWFGNDTDMDQTTEANDNVEEILTEQQKRLLEAENAQLMEQMDGTLDSVRNAIQALSEISELQNTLAQHLSAQDEQINTIQHHVEDADVNVSKGNENLKSAQRYFGGPRYWVGWFFIIASFVLLFLDYYWP